MRTTGFSVLLIAAVFGACSDSANAPAVSAPVKVRSQAITSAPTKTVDAALEESKSQYTYSVLNRRDPFSPIIETEKTKSAKDKPPLERYNITEFNVSGIVWGGFGYNAILESPDGKGYFVRVGTILGPNRGVVKKITHNMLVIEEKFKTYTGETERKEIVVEMRKKQEDTP